MKNEIDWSFSGIKISSLAQDLIANMLKPSPEDRISWYALFNHPIFDETYQPES